MQVIRNNLKQQPQIKVSDLRRLPFIMNQNSKFFAQIISLNPIDRMMIDQIIYQEFNFTHSEINEIEYFGQSL